MSYTIAERVAILRESEEATPLQNIIEYVVTNGLGFSPIFKTVHDFDAKTREKLDDYFAIMELREMDMKERLWTREVFGTPIEPYIKSVVLRQPGTSSTC